MPGGGFDAPKSSVRGSLANLDDGAYTAIGKRLRELGDEYYQRWKAEQKRNDPADYTMMQLSTRTKEDIKTGLAMAYGLPCRWVGKNHTGPDLQWP